MCGGMISKGQVIEINVLKDDKCWLSARQSSASK